MAGALQKAMVWLGLAPDDEYDDYPQEPVARPGAGRAPNGPGNGGGPGVERRPAAGPSQAPRPTRSAAPGRGPAPSARSSQRSQAPGGAARGPEPDPAESVSVSRVGGGGQSGGFVRQLPPQGALADDPRQSRGEETPTVRAMRPSTAKPSFLQPASFDDAKEIADLFKADRPVVMVLGGLDRDLSRRLIDFASGICYALGGNMERVKPGSYLLVPAPVEVSEDDKRRLRETD